MLREDLEQLPGVEAVGEAENGKEGSLRTIQEPLGEEQFQRVHRNAIVNVRHVRIIGARLMVSPNGRVLWPDSCERHNARRRAVRATEPLGPKADAAAEDTGAVFRADTRVAVSPTTVVDKTGHFITDLPKSAFAVYENKDPQKFTMKREDAPVSLGWIIDNSGSMRDKRKKGEAPRSIWCWHPTGKTRPS